MFRYCGRALRLLWDTSPTLGASFAVLTLFAAFLPAAIAYVGKLIVDAVANPSIANPVTHWVIVEGCLVVAMLTVQRGLVTCESFLHALMAQRVNEMILEKAVTLELTQFEDSEFYDKLTRARREASSRPVSMIRKTFGLAQSLISLVAYGALLTGFSPWAAAVLVLAGVPAFLVEAKFSGDAFRLFTWRSPETREQTYLETVLAREDHVKEVKLYDLGPLLLERYKTIFKRLYTEDRKLTIRRNLWGLLVALVATLAFYGAYGWIALDAVKGAITLGAMTMYLVLFRQGQAAVSASLGAVGGIYEDSLYLSTLYTFLEQPSPSERGTLATGAVPEDGIRFENVSFAYPGSDKSALEDVSLHIKPGQKLAIVGANGSGKTTLIKLLTRLYRPTRGRVLLDGTDLEDWLPAALHARVAVIFQDFIRYQLPVGENIGAGDVAYISDAPRQQTAADKGMAAPFIEEMRDGYKTQLGKWFKDGQELSGGQWQKVALSRAFMRADADILVLDEPTSAMDAAAELEIFERIRALTERQIAILIAHRFSTVRIADDIIVIERGRIIEQGSHDELMTLAGTYARLFTMQAASYR
ncbi:MAG: ABC transporter ATP-binding protein [Clostridia bacterium]|nr:ABC transporter ATP-binding protein [Deltaproteobacteria bacterium]